MRELTIDELWCVAGGDQSSVSQDGEGVSNTDAEIELAFAGVLIDQYVLGNSTYCVYSTPVGSQTINIGSGGPCPPTTPIRIP